MLRVTMKGSGVDGIGRQARGRGRRGRWRIAREKCKSQIPASLCALFGTPPRPNRFLNLPVRPRPYTSFISNERAIIHLGVICPLFPFSSPLHPKGIRHTHAPFLFIASTYQSTQLYSNGGSLFKYCLEYFGPAQSRSWKYVTRSTDSHC